MRFTPKYTVSYKGVFHKAGVPFDIDGADVGEMTRHGFVEAPVKPDAPVEVGEASKEEEKPVRKGGRPRKVSG